MEKGSIAPAGAVFLSYASEDTEAAQRICEALRSAGVEVWFDKSELRGGDAWDRSIRQQIHDCALFVPVISQHTHERLEGYFRREWKLAVDRTHDMAEIKAFLVPVVIDGTTEQDPTIPEKFRELQWTRLPAGQSPPAFVERVQRLLSGPTLAPTRAHASPGVLPASGWSRRVLPIVAVLLIGGAVAYLSIARPWVSKAATAPAAVAFAPPAHSVAVLPFVNMSGDKEQEYFSDGLTEELLNSLAGVEGLQVAGRTSSFFFKGKEVDLATVAHKLNVAAVLEGSVRRSGHTIRVTAQLINGATGFHLWSKSYDHDLGDVLTLQTEIATAVATALKVALLGDVSTKIELGGTRDSIAFDAYLRGSKALNYSVGDANSLQTAIAEFTEAIQLDPHYALAFAGRALALARNGSENALDPAAIRQNFDKARADAQQAIALAPSLAEGYRALGYLEATSQRLRQASEAYERALALAPGDARLLAQYSRIAVLLGRTNAGIAAGERAVTLDPLNPQSHYMLGDSLRYARRYREALVAYDGALALEPGNARTLGSKGLAYYGLGNFQGARTSCEANPEHWFTQWCLALVYDKLGRRADAEGTVAKMKASMGDSSAYQYATIYAQWGDRAKALEWLETAMRLRDPGLVYLKTDLLMDPLRQEPRLQAVMKALKYPD
jgi:TolB-like protein/tetratricopeptide (TPR) repeat protein